MSKAKKANNFQLAADDDDSDAQVEDDYRDQVDGVDDEEDDEENYEDPDEQVLNQ